jgi:hypothetical protein
LGGGAKRRMDTGGSLHARAAKIYHEGGSQLGSHIVGSSSGERKTPGPTQIRHLPAFF